MKKYHFPILLACICLLLVSPAVAQRSKKKDYLVTLTTDAGSMRFVLFDQAPQHKANFIKLAKDKFYDGLLFHRIIESFMIQGGDPNSRQAAPGVALGSGSTGYLVPAEFHPDLFHRKGAVAAARNNNPEKASSGCQFYIVQGRKWTEETLEAQLARAPRKPTEAQKQVYLTEGGSPHLDGGYTVFGQVIDGLSVIDSIAARPRSQSDRPLQDVAMKVSVERMKKKKITKQYGYVFP
jgi:cyclophilin family peptidyl-prolyl cis-trans isomerase